MASDEQLKAAFAVLDVDSNGTLSRDEFQKILARPSADGTPSALDATTIDDILNLFDTNGDGLVSVEEYVTAMRVQGMSVAVAEADTFVAEWAASTAKQEARLAELLGWQEDFMGKFHSRRKRRAHWRSAWNYYMHEMPGGPFQTRADLQEQYLGEIEADPAFDELAAKVASGDATAEAEFATVMEQEDKLEASYAKLNQKIRDIIAGPGAPAREEFIIANYVGLPEDWQPPNPAEWPGDWLSGERLLGLGTNGEYPRTSGPNPEQLGTAH